MASGEFESESAEPESLESYEPQDDFEEPEDALEPEVIDIRVETGFGETQPTPAAETIPARAIAAASIQADSEPERVAEDSTTLTIEHSDPVIEVSAANPIRKAFDPTHWRRILKGN